jgi:hypothetical protein
MEVLLKSVRLRYLPNVVRVGLSWRGGWKAVYERSKLVFRKVIATEHRIPSSAQAYMKWF